MKPWPNKSPEPTAVGAASSAIAVHAASRRCPSTRHLAGGVPDVLRLVEIDDWVS